jgi:hypothetical protein
MPASTLVTTPGAATANAYCDLAFANQYHLDRPVVGVTWSGATDEQKNQAILWATKLMDALWCWSGAAVDAIQVLQWPRQGIIKTTGYEYVSTTIIPIELQRATAEYARQLLASDLAGNSDIETLKITALRAGPVAFSFGEGVVAKPVPDTVFNLIPTEWGYPRSRSKGYQNLVRA